MSNDFPVEIDGKTGEIETLPPAERPAIQMQAGHYAGCKARNGESVS
jgi:hypothetical protein